MVTGRRAERELGSSDMTVTSGLTMSLAEGDGRNPAEDVACKLVVEEVVVAAFNWSCPPSRAICRLNPGDVADNEGYEEDSK